MKEITLHIDSRIEFLGQVLMVTDNATGATISYAVEGVNTTELERFSTTDKIHFHCGASQEQRREITRYFTAVLGSAERIDIYGDRIKTRFPSTCAYTFTADALPVKDADPPFNFDYGVCRAVTPLTIKRNADLTAVLSELQTVAHDRDRAYGFPGVTRRASFLKHLESVSCPEIEEDVVSEPWRSDFEESWWPSLREDGSIGVYECIKEPEKAYLIAETALPFFICDQLLILIRQNPNSWTWAEWAESEEVQIASTLARLSVTAVQERALSLLQKNKSVRRATERYSSERVVSVSNTLRTSSREVVYDAEISRPSDWHINKVLFVRFVALDDGTMGYALLRNVDCGGEIFDMVIPSMFSVPSTIEAEDSIRCAFDVDQRAMISVDILKQIETN